MYETKSVELLKKKKIPQPQKCEYELRSVVCDYGIYLNGKLILVLNDYINARNILDILKCDEQKKRYLNNLTKYPEQYVEENVRVQSYLARIGISVYDEQGKFRSLEDILKQCADIHKIE